MLFFLKIYLTWLAICLPALAQTGQPIKQSGNVAPTHAWCVTTNGIAQDCGTAAIPFLTSIGAVYNGPSICAWSALSTSGAAQELCLGATTAGGAEITVQNVGSASALPLLLNLNGTIYQFPFSTSGVIGPSSSMVGDIAEWNNTSGTLLKDVTPTAMIDQLCATNGDLLVRLTGTWQCQATGTSGHVVPFLDGANTWSATQTFADGGAWSSSGISGLLSLAITGGTLSAGASALAVTVTQPASPATKQEAVSIAVTGAGSANQVNDAFAVAYNAGYTGANRSIAADVDNLNAGTAATVVPASSLNNSRGNMGIASAALGSTTTGYNFGINGFAGGGLTNVGGSFLSQSANNNNSGANIAVVGSALNNGTGSPAYQIGGWFSLNQTTTPSASAALIADNASQSNPVALFQVAGTTKVEVDASGNLTAPASSTLTIVAPSSGNIAINLGSDATGDLYYRNSSGNFTRLPIGTTNQQLAVSGGLPAWTASTNSVAYLCTITANNSASLNNASPTSGSCPLNNTYTSYQLIFQNIIPATDEKILELQVHSANGGASYKTTGYITSENFCANSTCAGGNPTVYIPLTYPSDANAAALHNAAPGFSGTVVIMNPSVSGLISISTNSAGYLDGGGLAGTTSTFGYWNTAAAVDGFQVLMDSGNITSGSILVYGIQ
jgi:hypothetical protein